MAKISPLKQHVLVSFFIPGTIPDTHSIKGETFHLLHVLNYHGRTKQENRARQKKAFIVYQIPDTSKSRGMFCFLLVTEIGIKKGTQQSLIRVKAKKYKMQAVSHDLL